jgi:hypothetical protein
MKIDEDLEIVDLALFLKREKTLILADLHIGYEEALNKQGLLIPRLQQKDLIKKLISILEKTKPKLIIINGDIKHEFGTISETEWRNTLKVLDLLSKYSKKIILIKGNHDTILGPIADKRNIKVKDYYKINNYYICHGHKLHKNKSFNESKIIIIGHEHPAISLRRKFRSELYKCFLIGNFKNKKLIVQPNLNLITEGTDVLKEELLSPYLQKDLSNFRVIIIADKTYDFGEIKNLHVKKKYN